MTEPHTHDSQALHERAVSHYSAGDLLIDVGRQRVLRDNQTIALPKLSFDLLVALARAAPNLVSSEVLLRQVWPRVVVGPETLNQRVKLVRDALGDDSRHPRYVEGLRGRGYRLVPPVEVRFIQAAAPASSGTPAAHASDVASALPVAVAATHHAREAAAANRAAGSALPESAAPAVASGQSGGRHHWRVRGLWVSGLLLGLMGGTLVPSPWRQATSTTPPNGVQAIAIPPRTVAVLPFENLGPTADDDYITLGVADAVLHQLSGDPQLIVVARSSSFSLGEPTPDAREAGRRLGVRYVVEGSVQHAGSLLRVTAQLIDTRTDRELWSTKLDRGFGAILQLQDQLSEQVARELEVTVHARPAPDSTPVRNSGVR